MKVLRSTLAGLALAAMSQTCFAFQEQGSATQQGAAAAGTNLNVPNQPIRGTGAEIRIPGLGPVGTLPKFDFGLELLYGAGEPKGIREELNKSEPSDLQIRGTLKYRFPN